MNLTVNDITMDMRSLLIVAALVVFTIIWVKKSRKKLQDQENENLILENELNKIRYFEENAQFLLHQEQVPIYLKHVIFRLALAVRDDEFCEKICRDYLDVGTHPCRSSELAYELAVLNQQHPGLSSEFKVFVDDVCDYISQYCKKTLGSEISNGDRDTILHIVCGYIVIDPLGSAQRIPRC